ncbi:hypothetical protein QA639_28470 [Bradyrhizobium pachyrhizi]|uniref:hypothetical protein n=1 Tax=Bradyrhizobium pachyrhizi TaxID=280333 RepID=UPI0024B0ED1C|nr:hypothetical protein [Bradyrhizobium pachyrhizi]WFU60155.1 hypothetical protein QA639_28470 [Bradyrhizobium pachyrhizi]
MIRKPPDHGRQIDPDRTIGVAENVIDQGELVPQTDQADDRGRHDRPASRSDGATQMRECRRGAPSAVDDMDDDEERHHAGKQRQIPGVDRDPKSPKQEAGETARREGNKP